MTPDSPETFGVSMSTGCVRGVVVSADGRITDAHYAPVSSEHPLASAVEAAAEMARTVGHSVPVVAVGGEPGETYAAPGARLVGECDAFLAAARVEGSLDFARVVAVVDFGRVATRIHVLDAYTGELYSSIGTDAFSGDGCDATVLEYLTGTYGATEEMTPDAVQRLARDCTVAKEMLSDERAVDLSGPFLHGSVRLRRTEFEEIIGPALLAVIASVVSAASSDVDAVLLVGGGASIPVVQRSLAAAVRVPVVTPRWPQLFAASGAAHLSAVIPVPFDPRSLTVDKPVAATVLASAAPVAPEPRDDFSDADTTSFPVIVDPAHDDPAHDDADTAALDLPGRIRNTDHVDTGAIAATAAVRRTDTRRRRRSRTAALVGSAALIVVATFGAAAAATGRSGDLPISEPDRPVTTSAVDIAAATTVDPAPSAAAASSAPATSPTTDRTTTEVTSPADDPAARTAPAAVADPDPTTATARPTPARTAPQASAPEVDVTTRPRPDRTTTRAPITSSPVTSAPVSSPAVTTPRPTASTPAPTTRPTPAPPTRPRP